jgi:hypothetical protein
LFVPPGGIRTVFVPTSGARLSCPGSADAGKMAAGSDTANAAAMDMPLLGRTVLAATFAPVGELYPVQS